MGGLGGVEECCTILDNWYYIKSSILGINVTHDRDTARAFRVNLTPNLFRDYCSTIKSRSPLTPLPKQGGLIVERLNQGYEGY